MNLLNVAALSLLFLFSTYANAQTQDSAARWALNTEKSEVNFISAQFTIKPDSVDSRVPIRNERMREFLFETNIYPTIEINANVGDLVSSLKPGQSNMMTIPASLSMHGATKEIKLETRLSVINANTIVVSSTQPVLIRAADFDMVDGITKLASLVNNLAIAETVPVNFSLELDMDASNKATAIDQ